MQFIIFHLKIIEIRVGPKLGIHSFPGIIE